MPAVLGGVSGGVKHVFFPLHSSERTGRARSAISREQQVLAACARCRAPLLHWMSRLCSWQQWQQQPASGHGHSSSVAPNQKGSICGARCLEKSTFVQTKMHLAVGQLSML